MESLDARLCSDLATNIGALSTSGSVELDPEKIKKVKNVCRISDEYVKQAYHLTMHHMEQEHAEIRLCALFIVDELFRRSHAFREMVLDDFQYFLELTVEIDPDFPLPPPKSAAKTLKSKALQFIQQWHDKFSEAYKPLKLGYKFLKECKKVDFSDIQNRSVAERRREEQVHTHRERVLQESVRKVLQDIQDRKVDIETCLTQIDNAISLLLESVQGVFTVDDFQEPQPGCSKNLVSDAGASSSTQNADACVEIKPDEKMDEDGSSLEELSKSYQSDMIQQHGLGSHTYNLVVDLSKVSKGIQVDADNAAIVASLQDLVQSIGNVHLPAVEKWIQVFTKAGSHADQLKKSIDVKQALVAAVTKYNELNISGAPELHLKDNNDSDDEEFEDVPEKDGFEETLKLPVFSPNAVPHQSTSKATASPYDKTITNRQKPKLEEEKDPTTVAATLRALAQKIQVRGKFMDHVTAVLPCPVSDPPSTTSASASISCSDPRKQELLAKAPKLRYDVDLLRWGEKLETPLVVKPEGLHRFWQPFENDHVEVKPETAELLRMRKIEYTGNFTPVKWQCRAPLPSGKLCPRYDRHKCPFHGPVIGRDKMGNPTDPEDIEKLKRVEEARRKDQPPDWQDPELLKDLEAATGLDLTVGKKKKRGKKKSFPGLTDLKEKKTSRQRLESKVLNKSTVKRIAATMDNLDFKRHRDKFADQFNYVHGTS